MKTATQSRRRQFAASPKGRFMKRPITFIACVVTCLLAGIPARVMAGNDVSAISDNFVPTDRLIVRLRVASIENYRVARDTLGAQSEARERVSTRLQSLTPEPLAPVRTMGDGSLVIRLSRRLPAAQLRPLIRQLAADAEVLEILPDRLYFPQLTPTDPLYASQWNLSQASGINMPAAWDITTGNPNLVIAILDTGMLPHNDLAARWIGGYDFVSLADRSNDGNLRDADATDPGDWVTMAESMSGPLAGCPVTNSRWHGTAMAGIIGSTGNNGTGIAGINWQSKLLPVRVVGKCGGYESDIADGMRWAVGVAIAGVPANTNVASVLNVSLSAAGTCSTVMQNALNDVAATNVPVVVAAGNNTLDAAGFSPGNCANTITVGAVDRNGGKPTYANFGNAVNVSAPGGIAQIAAGTPDANWILTTANQGITVADPGTTFYATQNGTSPATAHVAGVASLMRSVNPSLSAQFVKEALRNTARTFPTNTTTAGSQADCTVSLCGNGIVDARAAVQAASTWGRATPSISGGFRATVALRSDGTVVSWGTGTSGALGNGMTTDVAVPVAIPSLAGIVTLSTGVDAFHRLAVRADGVVFAWGRNTDGQLGDGTQTDRLSPIAVPGLTAVTQAAAGAYHSMALKRDGTVWTWGSNLAYQLGDLTIGQRSSPAPIPDLSNVVAIAASELTSFALTADGMVWQSNFQGFLSLTQVTAIAAGDRHLLALKSDGTVWCYGSKLAGVCGDGTNANVGQYTPQQVPGLSGVVAIAAGGYISLALKADGSVWIWGGMAVGEFNPLQMASPQLMPGITGVVRIGAGSDTTYMIKPDGSVWATGVGDYNALGNNTQTGVRLPVQVLDVGGAGFLTLGVSDSANFAPKTDVAFASVFTSNAIAVNGIGNGAAISITGGLYSISCNGSFTGASGTINNNSTVCVRVTSSAVCGSIATAMLSIAGFPAKTFTISTAACDSYPDPFPFATQAGVAPGAVITSNTVTLSGINTNAPISVSGAQYSIGCTGTFVSAAGQIGNNATVCLRLTASTANDTIASGTLTVGTRSATFDVVTAPAAGFTATRQISGGRYFAHGLQSNGTLQVFGLVGFADYNATFASWQPYPSAVARLSGVSFLGTGPVAIHAAAIRADGTLWTWGNNDIGQLGDGSQVSRSTPARVIGVPPVARVAVDCFGTLALMTDGTVWAWGANSDGQLADGTNNGPRVIPAQIQGLSGIIDVAAGCGGQYALRNDGTVLAWGTFLDSAPAPLIGMTQIASFAAGGNHLLALRADGSLLAWGSNTYGELGNGMTSGFPSASTAAVAVSELNGVVGIAAGYQFSLALKSDGTVWSWGRNHLGQLGDGTLLTRLTPVQVPGMSNVQRIGAGRDNAYAIKSDGSVWAWGGAYGGALGNNNTSYADSKVPVQIVGAGGSGFLNLGVADSAVFAPQTDVPLSSVRTSNAITISGVGAGATASISGGSYSIGCTGTFVTAAGPISNSATICLRQSSSSNCGTATLVSLSVTGLPPKTFSVTTQACDLTPNRFYFLPQGSVPPSAQITSAPILVNGMTNSATISVSGGQYSIGCTPTFTSAVGAISNNQTVCVRLTAAATSDTLTSAVLTVGTFSAPFDVMTSVSSSFSIAPQLAAGWLSQHMLRSDGRLFAWGGVSTLGDGRVGFDAALPNLISSISGVTNVATANSEYYFGLAVRSDGTLWSWGDNRAGQLGDGTANDRNLPQRVPGLPSMSRVARGELHSVALSAAGTVWTWGANASGQLGDGTTTEPRYFPAQVAGLTGVIDVAAYGDSRGTPYARSFALKGDGTVWAWGSSFGIVPVAIAGFSQITAISAGAYGLIAKKADGTAWVWGGLTGDGTTNFYGASALQVPGLSSVTAVTAGYLHYMVLKSDGTIWTWGINTFGELGDGTTLTRYSPVQVVGIIGALQISAGVETSFALMPNGTVRAWGSAYYGALGNYAFDGFETLPTQVLGAKGNGYLALLTANTVPAPFAFTAAIGVALVTPVTSNAILVTGLGTAVSASISIVGGEYAKNGGSFTTATGSVINGDLVVVRAMSSAAFSTTTSATLTVGGASGESSFFFVRTRLDTAAPRRVPQVVAGDSHTFILGSDGTIYAAGYNGNGQLGNGTTLGSFVFRPVANLSGASAIASGAFHGLALRADKTIAAWGSNAGGQLGSGVDNNSERYPVSVAGLGNVVAIAAGDYHSLALRSDGTVWAWGLNIDGQAGAGTATSRYLSPVQVVGVGGNGFLTGVTAIAAGSRHNLAVRVDGSVVAWGANGSRQLGDSTTTNRLFPVVVSTLTSGILSVAGGGAHSYALRTDATVVAWGDNAFGQLGDGSFVNRTTPVAVSGLTQIGRIASGANHGLAIKAGGQLYTWGNNANSQLGDGGLANRGIPFAVVIPVNVVSVAAGGRHSTAINNAGKLYN